MEPDEKKCPYCAEVIKAEAIKCKHCLTMLEAAEEDESSNNASAEAQTVIEMSAVPEQEPSAVERVNAPGDADAVSTVESEDPERSWSEQISYKQGLSFLLAVGAIAAIVFLFIYGARALLVEAYIAIGVIVIVVIVAGIATSRSGVSSTRKEILQASSCKYCGQQLSGNALATHILSQHTEAYRNDLSKPVSAARLEPRLSQDKVQGQAGPIGKPTCPTCGSTRVTRFSRTWKVTKVASIGVFGLGNAHKIFHCKNCGYKW